MVNTSESSSSDVVIIGGGLAGLGLAQQLRQARPELEITVLERSCFPIASATAKVGESTVEIGSHYLRTQLGLSEHFQQHHLKKFGLRCFLGGPQSDFADHDEYGASTRFALPTYQLERGVLENHLYALLVAQGVRIDTGVTVASVDAQSEVKSVEVADAHGKPMHYKARWLIDCAGRQALLKNHLNLGKASPHKGNAVWFRVDKTIKIDDWSSNRSWADRVTGGGQRWLSTNHLMGPGYWVWIIPLGSGVTSIGVVMDDPVFEQGSFGDYQSCLRWLGPRHPQLAQALADAKPLDYVAVRDYSFACKQVFSEQGWGMSGEAGVFADPFYSPGSDFIALGNTILTQLISRASHGEDIRIDTRVYQLFFNSFFSNTVSLYRDQYGGFGDRQFISVKLLWDTAFYWGILVAIYLKGAVSDASLMRSLGEHTQTAIALNQRMQERLRARAQQRLVLPARGAFVDQYQVPMMHRFMDQLMDPSVTLLDALPTSIELLSASAPYLEDLLADQPQPHASNGEQELLGQDFRHQVLAL